MSLMPACPRTLESPWPRALPPATTRRSTPPTLAGAPLPVPEPSSATRRKRLASHERPTVVLVVPKSCPFQAQSGQFRRTPAHDDATGSFLCRKTYEHFRDPGAEPENPGVGGSIPSLPTIFSRI